MEGIFSQLSEQADEKIRVLGSNSDVVGIMTLNGLRQSERYSNVNCKCKITK